MCAENTFARVGALKCSSCEGIGRSCEAGVIKLLAGFWYNTEVTPNGMLSGETSVTACTNPEACAVANSTFVSVSLAQPRIFTLSII